MIIDGHSHVNYPLKEHIQQMDKNNISKTILFRTIVHPEQATNYKTMTEEMGRLNNLLNGNAQMVAEVSAKAQYELISAIHQYPDRYMGFGFIPLGLNEQETIEKIDLEIVKNGLIGLGEYTLASGTIPIMKNLFRALSYFKNLPVWIHGFNPLNLKDIIEISNLAKKYSEVPVIIGHLGGSNWLETIPLVKAIPNLYLDISAFFSTLVLKIVINEIPEKCVFGVDLPYGDIELSLDAVKKYAGSLMVYNQIVEANILSILER